MPLAKVVRAALYAPAPSTTRGESTSLSATPKGDFLVYGAGKLVIIRSAANPLQATLYAEHQGAVRSARRCARPALRALWARALRAARISRRLIAPQVTAVAVSPNGEWIASGDERGTVRIWANQPERTLKLETFALGGKVLDIAWSGDGQRVLAVGEGQQSYGKVFTWDSGNTVGAIDSHSKRIITGAFKPTRPFRIATGSDDLNINWYEGPPFKFKSSFREHTRYPNCVRFSPDGEQLISVGSDSKIVMYNGPTGQKVADITCDDMHTGAIYACAWAPDSKQLLTVSADKTAKVWHVDLGQPHCTIVMAEHGTVGDMQVGCCWQGATVASLSLSGRINLIDPAAGKVVSSLMGHNRAITALSVDRTTDKARFASASFDGVLAVWDARTGGCQVIDGTGHENGIVDVAFLPGDILASAALDRTVRFSNLQSGAYNGSATVQLGARHRATRFDAARIAAHRRARF